MKKFLGLTLVGMTAFSNTNVMAEQIVLKEEPQKLDIMNLERNSKGEIVITDKEMIKQISLQDGDKNYEKIDRIVYTFSDIDEDNINIINNNEPKENETNNKATGWTWHISNVKDLGSGYTYATQYDESIYYGPSTVSQTYTKTGTYSYNTTVTIDSAIIKAAVGFNVTGTATMQQNYSFSVPNGGKIALRVLVNYAKTTYDVGQNFNGLIYEHSTGSAFRPVGLIFKQIVMN